MSLQTNKFISQLHYSLTDLPWMGGLLVVYALLAYGVSIFFLDDNYVSLIWPCSGVALAMLLLGGLRYIPVICLGEFCGNALSGYPVWSCAAFATINTLEYCTTYWVLTNHVAFDPRLRAPRDFFLLAVVGGVVGAISALISSSVLFASNFLSVDTLASGILHWWQGDLVGIFLVAPLILIWKEMPRDWIIPARRVECVAFLVLTVLAGQIVFLEWFAPIFQSTARGFMLFIFLTWAATKFGRHGAMLVITLVTGQALTGAVNGIGYFGDDLAVSGLQNLWLYVITLTVVGLSLALKVERQINTEEALRASQHRLHALMMRSERIREDERKHIAHEVHDELGQILTAVKMEIATLKRTLAPDASQNVSLDQLKALSESSLQVMRSVATSLRPPVLDMGLVAALNWLADNSTRSMQLPCKLETGLINCKIHQPYSTIAFRIIQEALTNAARHAKASKVKITVYQQGDELEISVEDDGIGFDTALLRSHGHQSMGIWGMMERAESLGGKLDIASTVGAGTSIFFTLPVHAYGEGA